MQAAVRSTTAAADAAVLQPSIQLRGTQSTTTPVSARGRHRRRADAVGPSVVSVVPAVRSTAAAAADAAVQQPSIQLRGTQCMAASLSSRGRPHHRAGTAGPGVVSVVPAVCSTAAAAADAAVQQLHGMVEYAHGQARLIVRGD